MDSLLEVSNLEVHFLTAQQKLRAVKDVSLSVKKGETLCIVGESGSGKSVTSLSLMGLLPSNGEITEGSILLKDKDLAGKTEKEMEKIRGDEISMIFQEPMTALNPTFTIGYQLREPLMIHRDLSKKEATKKAIELLNQVGIPEPEEKMKVHPHQLSGGMRQRVMIAMALACEPALLLADEPTTSLDVTIQAQILDLINDLKQQMDMGVVFVTHDMGVVAEIADRVIVMYAGEVIEQGDVKSIFNNPSHPYTEKLLESVPDVANGEQEISSISGSMPALSEQITGCPFHPRCPYAMDICTQQNPPYFRISEAHESKCWLREVKEDDRTANPS